MSDPSGFTREEHGVPASMTLLAHPSSVSSPNQTKQSLTTGTSRIMQIYTWIAMLFAFPLPNILWIWALGHKDGLPGESYVRLLILAVLLAGAMVLPRLRLLRGFLLALITYQLGIIVKTLFAAFPPIAAWLHTLSPVQFLLADSILWVVFGVLPMMLTLIGSGLSRQDLLLRKGNMLARSRLLAPVFPPVSWLWLVLVLFAALIVPFVLQLIQIVHPDPSLVSRILDALPLILAFGIINGLQEEIRFRIIFLARLAPIMGLRQTTILTAILFGATHWFGGHPDGLLGALTVALAGWILGMNILETRGVGWAWLIHAISDAVVAAVLAMSLVYR